MIKHTLLFTTFAIALLLTACSGGSDPGPAATPTSSGDPAAGETAFMSTCIACHGPDAKGITGLGKDLTTSEWVAENDDAALVEFLKTGRPAGDPLNTTGVDMPPRGGNPALTDEDLADIVAYLRSIHE
jgi:disulfide bond formation protein DsbB